MARRPKTAPPAEPHEPLAHIETGPGPIRGKLTVAVWWPREGGYGGGTRVANMDDARVEIEKLKRLGYGLVSKSREHEIHVVRKESQVMLIVRGTGDAGS